MAYSLPVSLLSDAFSLALKPAPDHRNFSGTGSGAGAPPAPESGGIEPGSGLDLSFDAAIAQAFAALAAREDTRAAAAALQRAWEDPAGRPWQVKLTADGAALEGLPPGAPLTAGSPLSRPGALPIKALGEVAAQPLALQGDGALRPEAEASQARLYALAGEIGAALGDALGPLALATLRLALARSPQGVTLEIVAPAAGPDTPAAALLSLPWACLLAGEGAPGLTGALALRHVASDAPTPAAEDALRVAVLIAGAQGALRGAQEEAAEALWRALPTLHDRLFVADAGGEAALTSLLEGWAPGVLVIRAATRAGQLLLEGPESLPEPLSEAALQALAGPGGPSLVVLDLPGDLNDIPLGRRLVAAGVPAVLILGALGPDPHRHRVLEALLAGLAEGDALADVAARLPAALLGGDPNHRPSAPGLGLSWVLAPGAESLRFCAGAPRALSAWAPGESPTPATSDEIPPPPWGVVGRRGPLAQAVDRFRKGERVLILRGPPGVGKTAFLSILAPALQAALGGMPTLLLHGRRGHGASSDLADLWQQVSLEREGAAWDGVLAEFQGGGLTGEALAEAVLQMAREGGGLLVVLDGAGELQVSVSEEGAGRFADPEVETFLQCLKAEASTHLGLVLTSRYGVEGDWGDAELTLRPMGPLEQLRLLRRFHPLNHQTAGTLGDLAARLDGRPASAVLLGALAVGLGQGVDPRSLMEGEGPVPLKTLMDRIWAGLSESDRTLLGLAAALGQGAPWEAIAGLAPSSGAGGRLARLGLLLPLAGRGSPWSVPSWARVPIQARWGGEGAEAHRSVGAFFAQRFEIEPHMEWDLRAVKHLSLGGDWAGAFAAARRLSLSLRAAGRHHEALALLEGLPPVPRSARSEGGLLAVFRCQLARLGGAPRAGAVEELRRAVGAVPAGDRSFALDELGQHLLARGRFEEAVATLEQSVAIERADKGDRHPDVAASLRALARAFEAQGDLERAQATLEQAIAGGDRLPGAGDDQRAEALAQLSRLLSLQGDLDGAQARLQESNALKRQTYGAAASPHISRSLQELAGVDMAMGRQEEALAKLSEMVDVEIEAAGGEAHPSVAQALGTLAQCALSLGKNDRALAALDRQVASLEGAFGVADLRLVEPLQHRAALKAQTGKMAGTAGDLQRTVTILKRRGGDPDALAGTLTQLAGVVQSLGDPRACLGYLEEALKIRQTSGTGPLDPEVLNLLTLIGGTVKALGDTPRSIEIFRQLMAQQAERHGDPDHLDVAVAETNLAQILLEAGDRAAAGPHIEHAYGVFLEKAGPTHPVTIQLARLVPGSEEGLVAHNPTAPYVKRTFAYLGDLRVSPRRLGRLVWRLMLREQAGPFLPLLLMADLECLTPGLLAESPGQLPPPTQAPQPVQMMWSGLIMELAQAHARFRYDFDKLLGHLSRGEDGAALPSDALSLAPGQGPRPGDAQALVDEARALIVTAEDELGGDTLRRELPLVLLATAYALEEDPSEGSAEMVERILRALPGEREALLERLGPSMSPAHRRALGVASGRA